MNSLNEIREKVNGDIEKIEFATRDLRKVLGYNCLSNEAKLKYTAISNIYKCLVFADTIEDLIESVNGFIDIDEVKKYMSKYMKHALKINTLTSL